MLQHIKSPIFVNYAVQLPSSIIFEKHQFYKKRKILQYSIFLVQHAQYHFWSLQRKKIDFNDILKLNKSPTANGCALKFYYSRMSQCKG